MFPIIVATVQNFFLIREIYYYLVTDIFSLNPLAPELFFLNFSTLYIKYE